MIKVNNYLDEIDTFSVKYRQQAVYLNTYMAIIDFN
jgi:hypothetical protein